MPRYLRGIFLCFLGAGLSQLDAPPRFSRRTTRKQDDESGSGRNNNDR